MVRLEETYTSQLLLGIQILNPIANCHIGLGCATARSLGGILLSLVQSIGASLSAFAPYRRPSGTLNMPQSFLWGKFRKQGSSNREIENATRERLSLERDW